VHQSQVSRRRANQFCSVASNAPGMEVDSCHPAGVYNFAVSPSYLEHLYASVRYANIFFSLLICSLLMPAVLNLLCDVHAYLV